MAVLRGFHVFAVAVAAATLVTGAAASASPGSTERAALADSGAEPDADVLGQVSMTPDGRFVVFLSASPALAAAPAAGTPPFAYLRDRALGRTELVGRGADGSAPVISADGRYVAFASRASDLVGGDTNGASDVFVVDRATGVTTRASVAGTGAQAAGASTSPSISADGRVVVFQSAAADLVPGDANGGVDVFAHDLQSGATTRVSVGAAGADAHGSSTATSGAVSSDGRYVAFTSSADNLVAADANGTTSDVFLRDLQAGTTELAGLGGTGAQPAGGTSNGFAGSGGRYVVFQCPTVCGAVAGNHVPTAIFVRDRGTGAVREATVSTSGEEASSSTFVGGVSADGRHVAFATNAANLAQPVTGNFDFYVHDDDTGTTERVSVSSAGDPANDSSITSGQVVGSGGRLVLFTSTATNLVAGDTNRGRDAFLRDRGLADIDETPPTVGPVALGTNPKDVHETTTVSADAADDRGLAGGELTVGDGAPQPMTPTGSTLTATIGTSLAPGLYQACVRAFDAAGNRSAPSCARLVVVDRAGAWVSGRGKFDGGEKIVFRARYQKRGTLPTGKTRVKLGPHGPVFRATEYDWLVVSGEHAEIEGSGTVDGAGSHPFHLTVDAPDRLRIAIQDVYDSSSVTLTSGSIVIHPGTAP